VRPAALLVIPTFKSVSSHFLPPVAIFAEDSARNLENDTPTKQQMRKNCRKLHQHSHFFSLFLLIFTD
jgi:hypothetical protein